MMKVSYSDLKQCSNELHSSYAEIEKILDNVTNIKTQISRSGSWSGKAAIYYMEKLNSLSKNFDLVVSELEKSALYLDKVIEGYELLDKKILDSFSNLNFSNINTSSNFK